MKKIFYTAGVLMACLCCTGCAGVTFAGAWAAICAGVSAGAAVWQASKTPEEKEPDQSEKTAPVESVNPGSDAIQQRE